MSTPSIDQPKTARGIATRARIVEAAAGLMRNRGVAGTSLDAVLLASGASKSQLYHYFADKDALVLAVIQRQGECVLAAQRASLRNVTSLAGLRRWRDAVVELSRQCDCAGGCPIGSLVAELAEAPQPRAMLADSFACWEKELTVALSAVRRRAHSRRDSADLALATLAALQGGLLLAQTMRSTRPLELALDMAIDHVARRLA